MAVVDAATDRLRAIYDDLCAGAKAEGEAGPRLEEVARLSALLAPPVGEDAVPAGLVPALYAALVEATLRRGANSRRLTQGPRALLRLLWAEARFLPLSFFVLQAALLAMALVANHALTDFAGSRLPLAAPGADLVARAVLRDALGRSADALTLVAPWLGAAAALFSALPRRKGLWADLEALSPFSEPTRLLARATVATLMATAAAVVAGLAQMGPAPAALLLLARTAPLFLAVGWALAWSVPFGAQGAAAASLALWGGLTWFGGRLGRWDPLAPPGAAVPAQALALAAGLVLFAVAYALQSRASKTCQAFETSKVSTSPAP